jgi:hypothetical protein
MDSWEQYFFERHDPAELKVWARRLRLFRYFRAFGGHANDGDSLDCAFRYRSTADLERFFSTIGVALVHFDALPLQPEPGVAYPGDEFARFPSLVPGTKWIGQPGHCEIAGIAAHAWCSESIITVSATPYSYDVTSSHVVRAERIETVLRGIDLEIQDPPHDSKHYFCPKYYSQYFRSN